MAYLFAKVLEWFYESPDCPKPLRWLAHIYVYFLFGVCIVLAVAVTLTVLSAILGLHFMGD
jgi:VanZ family protein